MKTDAAPQTAITLMTTIAVLAAEIPSSKRTKSATAIAPLHVTTLIHVPPILSMVPLLPATQSAAI